MLRSLLFIFTLLLALQVNLFSQSCAVKLRNAENEFNAGRVEGVPALLEDCLASGFTKAEEMKAYQIVIRSYLFDDRTALAESTMLEFLKKNPEYKVSPTDNADFVYLLNKYNIKPVIQVGGHVGGISTFITGVYDNNTTGHDPDSDYSNDQITFSAGVEVLIRITDKIDIGVGADYSEISFVNNEGFLQFASYVYSEKQRRLETPVHLYYKPVNYGKFFPYIKGGTGVAMNLSTTAEANQINKDINNPISKPPGMQEINDRREFMDPFVSFGLGCKFKLPKSYLFLDISTRIGTQIQAKAGNPGNLEYFYGITDDLFHINTFRFNVGYIHIFYKPSRREE